MVTACLRVCRVAFRLQSLIPIALGSDVLQHFGAS